MKKEYDKLLISVKLMSSDVIHTSLPTDPCSVDIFNDDDFMTGGEE